METQYYPRPQRPPSPPLTPPPNPSSTDPSNFLLNDESDALWLSALIIARSVQDPLGAKSINNIDDVILRKSPVLDVPLLWKIIHEAESPK
ncbi:hypothetical protein FRC00_006325 [Tulasnella sp. 408]|nr:hypothetical protein FRC00_006325 [Tulasnella sp. 408]